MDFENDYSTVLYLSSFCSSKLFEILGYSHRNKEKNQNGRHYFEFGGYLVCSILFFRIKRNLALYILKLCVGKHILPKSCSGFQHDAFFFSL